MAQLPRIAVTPPQGSALLRDYLAGESLAARYFSGHPHDPTAYQRKAREVDGRLDTASRTRLTGAFRPLSSAATHRLTRVLAGDGYFVTTGQQTGLFTGPLYTVYKALSAIRLAAALEPILSRPVLALFWVAADDHDWDEVSHATVLDARGYPQRIALRDLAGEAPMAMSHRRLTGSAELAVDALREFLPDTAFRDLYIGQLRDAYRSGRTMAEAFEAALAGVLEGLDIALVSSAHPLVKEHSVPVLARALEHAGEEAARVAGQTELLLAAGYHAQVSIAPGASNVFLQDDSGRERLVHDADGWSLRRTRRRLPTAALLERLHADPAAFSPNVLLRPVVESALFPTLAYVGGPAETSYFAQIGCLFQQHGITPPIVFPRHSVTIVEGGTAKALEKFGLDLAALQAPLAELIADVVRRELPADLTGSLERLRLTLAEGYEELAEAVRGVAPGMHRPVRGARHTALAQTLAIEKRILQHVRREQDGRFEQLRRAAASVYPGDSPQERMLNVYPYLARYGPELLRAIMSAMAVELVASHRAFRGVNCEGEALAPVSVGGIG